MGDVVRGIAEKLFEGYAASNLEPKPDFVVIGNSLSRGNVEVEAVIERGIHYGSMPELFSALLIGSREYCRTSVVVTGTHGKTTTSAAAAVMLDRAGLKPGYFIGGVPQDLQAGIRAVDLSILSEKRCVVLEGDEYDSAFFAKWPKFLSYRPDILIVTSLEFDHADIYESLEHIEIEFTRLVMSVPKGEHLIVCTDNDRLRKLVFEWSQSESFVANLHSYGSREDAEYKLVSRTPLEAPGKSTEKSNGAAQLVHYSLRGRGGSAWAFGSGDSAGARIF
jgi:UDP-N-acetylmuramate: L-alanyl-gamma-D-glutamyl-meso-diaminopimelate ligase